jgi:vitamin B12 transporter
MSLFCAQLTAQQNDTLQLSEVVITSAKAEKLNAGKKVERTDSLTLLNFSNTNLSELLSVNSPVYMKNYGSANLSTSSFRGGNASQTAVLWNGFNIQNSMLGQTDFSQLPNFLFDDIALEFGGSSGLWGSGAVGGSVRLDNQTRFSKGYSTLLNLGLGSYQTNKLNSRIHYSTAKFSTTTKVYYNRSKNNFTYYDSLERTQTHSNYEIKGLLQEIGGLLGNNKITGRVWYNSSFRNLPPTLGTETSKASQKDDNLKLNLDWNYHHKKFIPGIRIAYFDDQLDYTDSLKSIFSQSNVKTFISEADIYLKLNDRHRFYIGSNYTNYNATTLNYEGSKQLSKTALLAAYSLNDLFNKLNFDLTVRKEFSAAYAIPVTGNCGVSFKALKSLTLKATAAKVYRLPTLNDLYWKPGGNPNLKPEEGYTFDGTVELKAPVNIFRFHTEMSYFNKQITNWINWIPGPGGNSMPVNVLNVYSRGTETSSYLSYSEKNLETKLGFHSAYVLSTSQTSALPNDASVNKQLIYMPRYNMGGSFAFTFYEFSFLFYHNYVGYRFTTSDNSSWLDPYHLANMKLAYNFKMPVFSFLMAFHINNLYGTNYFVIDQRPMPFRNYEISITLTYNKPKKKQQNKSI